jgi:hypothetical protein
MNNVCDQISQQPKKRRKKGDKYLNKDTEID